MTKLEYKFTQNNLLRVMEDSITLESRYLAEALAQ